MTENAPWQKLGARKVANEAWALVERHEKEDHGGQPCPYNRIGLVAFIAHVIGLRAESAFDIEIAIHEYEREHDKH